MSLLITRYFTRGMAVGEQRSFHLGNGMSNQAFQVHMQRRIGYRTSVIRLTRNSCLRYIFCDRICIMVKPPFCVSQCICESVFKRSMHVSYRSIVGPTHLVKNP